jgi:S-adenosylmethionine synthetase
MFEKVNPSHPDKVADRIAGALVDLAYKKAKNPKIAVEVLIGHGVAFVISETSVGFSKFEVDKIVRRISGLVHCTYIENAQDPHLYANQKDKFRCGDNGIFKGCPVTEEQQLLTEIVKGLYNKFPFDGKYILDGKYLTACQSHVENPDDIVQILSNWYDGQNVLSQAMTVNPLGPWTGGLNVDCGATNRKLGSDMGDAVTGGGLHGKDLSKADVTVNIYCHIMAQKSRFGEFNLCCSIGDEIVDDRPYSEIVEIARRYIESRGGFEKFAEWGLIY